MNAQHILNIVNTFHVGAAAAIGDDRMFAQITCKKGCAACCRLLAVPHGLEVAFLTDWMLGAIKRNVGAAPFWSIIDRSIAVASKLLEPCSHDQYHQRQIDCPLLGAERECLAYDFRPGACRYHYVISPPELCERHGDDDKIMKINLKRVEAEMLGLFDQMSHDRLVAPLPVRLVEFLHEFAPRNLGGADTRRIRAAIWDAGIEDPVKLTRSWHDYMLGENARKRLETGPNFIRESLTRPDVQRALNEGNLL